MAAARLARSVTAELEEEAARQRHPSVRDQHPAPRTEPRTEPSATSSEVRASQRDTSQASEDLDVQGELNELVLLFAILAGFVVLAGAML